ncbi:RNA polymerase sigma factor (sigma-70 family) [Dyadobacter jejuensis]|uniref:RNA polymerase sigma factor (Sigma-70 family) n=1 Tax=Dyadobacter jejuensis TaxID=1082580 RepID=A0A316AIW3_9BACT|nr:sigma-70 family RNA polymerase sigma factor [Dyadobacter jejuensis]PWJ57169.1 RNA polymerase sigma factor (sigma-70 family) [Dyadobacter jejuensis]
MKKIEPFGVWETEPQLWKAVRSGDEAAFTFLFEKYHPHLYNYGSKLTSETDLLEDAIQDVFIDIWRLREGLTEQVLSIRYYLLRCLRRRIRKGMDRHSHTDDLSAVPEEVLLAQSLGDTEQLMIAAESEGQRKEMVQKLINSLPQRQLEAITLRYYEGLSNEQIAQMMGVSQKSVRNFLYKALTHMRLAQELAHLTLWCLALLLNV